jgi:hypothetical protein
MIAALFFAILSIPAIAQQKSLFPESLPSEVEVTVGRRSTVIPDGTDGLHYFPDGPLSILSS